jgi:hypothetical protein
VYIVLADLSGYTTSSVFDGKTAAISAP